MSNPRSDALSILEIHLDLVRRNYLFLQKKLVKGADCAAVVKADAYGLGAAAVVPELYKANCRHFYVAHVSEGLAVRAALESHEGGQKAQIYVFYGPCGAPSEDIIRAGLIPVLNTPEDIAYWSDLSRKTEKRQPAVLHIDTGMNRLGLTSAEVSALKHNAEVLKPLDVRYVMSHLACADTPEHPKNAEQLDKFKRLATELGLPCRLSLANSAGIFLGGEYHFDQVRPGCALYGINPQSASENPMQGVISLKARILQIRDAFPGETVGYGASYQVANPQKLATISAGYADGILRSLAGQGRVYIAGRNCPVVGRVSMDAIVVDVTAVRPEPHAGDWAELIGPHQTVDDLAAQAKTIGYEILTGLGKRYARSYTGR